MNQSTPLAITCTDKKDSSCSFHLQVDDQMKLLQNSWSDLLVLDHMHQRMHNGLPDEMTLANGQKFDLLALALLGIPAVVDSLNEVQNKFAELKLDSLEYLCVKFLLLLNPGQFQVTHAALPFLLLIDCPTILPCSLLFFRRSRSFQLQISAWGPRPDPTSSVGLYHNKLPSNSGKSLYLFWF